MPLPIEIVEQIIVAIDEPRDLLSLGLCSKTLSGLVFPYHIQLRKVKCDILQDDLWGVLSNYPSLAKLVRRLQIVRLGSVKNPIHPLVLSKTFSLTPLSPSRSSEGNSSASLSMVLTAIRCMDLTEFSWNSDGSTYIHLLTILRTVFRCNPGLRTLRLNFQGREALWDYSPLAPAAMPYLTSLSLSAKLLPRHNSSYETLSPLADFIITYCPNLLHLEFSVESLGGLHIPQIIRYGNWPMLRVLVLQGPVFHELRTDNITKAYVMSSFLARHRWIQCLCLDGPDLIFPSCIPPESLPELISLSVTGLQSSVSLESILASLKYTQLRHITWEFLNRDLSLLREMISLQSCNAILSTTTDVQPRELIRSLPLSIERFNLSSWLHWSVEEMHRTVQSIVQEIPRLKNLTHLGGLPRAMEQCAPRGGRLVDKANLLSHLQYLEAVINYQPTWVTVMRNWCGKICIGTPAEGHVHPMYWAFQVADFGFNNGGLDII